MSVRLTRSMVPFKASASLLNFLFVPFSLVPFPLLFLPTFRLMNIFNDSVLSLSLHIRSVTSFDAPHASVLAHMSACSDFPPCLKGFLRPLSQFRSPGGEIS